MALKKTLALPHKEQAPAKPNGGALTTYEQKLAEMAKAAVATESSVSTGNFINTRGGVLSYNGQQMKNNTMNAVVVDYVLENTFYTGVFDSDNPSAPVCYAFGRDADEMVPHEKAHDPQAASCAACPHNKFGSEIRDGKPAKGKACKNIRRLGLLSVPTDKQGNIELDEDAVGEQEIAYLKVPVTSVKGWAVYVRTLEVLAKRPPCGVVTQISLHPDQQTNFRMAFEHVLDLPGEVGMAVLERQPIVQDGLVAPYPEAQNKEEFAPKPAASTKPAARRKF
jgi:hypothetical protein